MKRVLLSILGTVAGMSALLSFKTHAGAGTDLSLPAASLPGASVSDGVVPGGTGGSGSPSSAGSAPPGAGPAARPGSHASPQASSGQSGSAAQSGAASTGSSTGRQHAGGGSAAQQSPGATRTSVPTSPRSSGPAPHSSAPPVRTTSAAPPPPPKTSSPAPPVSHTYTGQAVQTRYGVVQVEVTMTGSTITNVAFVQLTANDSRSRQINQHAGPILLQETLSAQSANVDTVSGATYTSRGYVQSLQSALDQA